ncbi:prepilin peptidase [Thermaurantiacus sp.]
MSVLAMMSAAAAAALMLIAAAWDLAMREIPNRAAAGIALAALPTLLGQPLASALAVAAVAAVLFGLGIVAFRFALVGGGDVKLLGAVGLWVQPDHLGLFLAVHALVTLLLVTVMLLRAGLQAKNGGWSAARLRNESLPFGVPIAAGGLAALMAGAGLLAQGVS